MCQLDEVEEEETAEEVARRDAEPALECARKMTVSPVPSVENSSPAAGLQPTFVLGLSSPRSTRAWIGSSVTVDGSQTVRGSGTGAFSIFPSSKLVDLDLNSTRDFVLVWGHSGGEPKLDNAAILSRCCEAVEP
jgi:hypothetical protein